jgi:putative selenate reductase FAD-binding subunit
MITAYHRPRTIAEALKLISRSSPRTLPLGGGTLLSHGQEESIEVVDLQALGLNVIQKRGNSLEVGATSTLQQLLEDVHCPADMRSALKLDAPLNLRNAATIAGTLVTGDGRSSTATALLALDSILTIVNSSPQVIKIGDFLPTRAQLLHHALITKLTFPLNVRLAFEYVARTPADRPIVCVTVAQWPSGRTRLAVGGYGAAPRLAMDGTEAEGLETAARNTMSDADDPQGSAAYRMDIGAILARRGLERVSA